MLGVTSVTFHSPPSRWVSSLDQVKVVCHPPVLWLLGKLSKP